ncbi:MAG: hypothetical protein OSA98_02715, partial [Rubripirellula sp.]|nr:hypothetical protein [Rubripirellula sp.]
AHQKRGTPETGHTRNGAHQIRGTPETGHTRYGTLPKPLCDICDVMLGYSWDTVLLQGHCVASGTLSLGHLPILSCGRFHASETVVS